MKEDFCYAGDDVYYCQNSCESDEDCNPIFDGSDSCCRPFEGGVETFCFKC